MRLRKRDIVSLTETSRIDGMPKDTFVAGFDDYDGGYYPIEALSTDYAGDECELYTYLTRALGGIEFYLRFTPPEDWEE